MKPYQQIMIQECGEALVPIPTELFAVVSPHPYQVLGAPYGTRSPFYLRSGVLNCLQQAQTYLQQGYPGWRIQIFDAYRPIAVQQFMVDYSFHQLIRDRGLNSATLTAAETELLFQEVYQFWALPSVDPATPPPHSTGAAVDVTLMDATNTVINMGSPIDEISPRSFPDHFSSNLDAEGQQYHFYRQLLREVMIRAGFQQHPNEWWHFCYGDQMWAWLTNQGQLNRNAIARYGRAEF